VGGTQPDAIVTMELFEVTTDDLTTRVFQFQPPTELEVKDRPTSALRSASAQQPARWSA
jgi:hypothetical protein